MLHAKSNLLPNQIVAVKANIQGEILLINHASENGSYKLTFSGLETSGILLANQIKLITYSSAVPGTLQNTGTVSFTISID